MTAKRASLESRLTVSGGLVFVGLVVEIDTLYWSHPLAFIAFLLLGGALVAAGVTLFLLSIAR